MSVIRAGLHGLNAPQREAATTIEGPVLILAGAGTGKTRVITTRIACMIASDIPAENVLAVTFTNKAASEMRERAATLMDKEDSKAVTISTFHSLCVRILRRNIDRLGYKRNFGIYSGADQLGLVRKIIVRKGGKDERLEPKTALSLIGKVKNRGIPVTELGDALMVEVYHAYQHELKTMNAVDFDDLLILTVQLLDEHEDVREFWEAQFPYIMVDEFQDTNSLQMRLLKGLAGETRNVCVVGDDDQSIYGWRGADITNILDFERYFPNPRVVKLEENYRCTMPILHVANSIIRHNTNRRAKTLWSAKESVENVRIIAMPGAEEEAETIVEDIVSGNSSGQPWENFAILFRMNAQSRLLEQTLRRYEVPYRVVGGMSFFDRREIRDILSYLMVLLNPEDDVNLLRILNNPPRGIGATTVKAATEFSMEHRCSVWEALQNHDYLRARTTKSKDALAAFVKLVREYQDVAHTESANYAVMLEKLLEEIGYTEAVRKSCKTMEESNMREQNVHEFVESMHSHRARSKKGLQHFLDEVSLMSDREEDEDISKKKGVCLITLHAAKGLEFPVVYLVGLEEGVLPHSRSIEEGSRDEERRLLYVGITRAKDNLTMTYCASRKRYGEPMPCQPSSFMKELDMEFIDHIAFDDLAAEPATEEAGESFFGNLKALLADPDEE